MMFFSVVIPSHRRKNLLTDLLNSLENQNLQDFEVVVVATEKDEAFSIDFSLYSFKNSIHFIPNDPSKGKSASLKRNFGAQQAKGEWIAFIDDDCLAEPQWLEEARKTIDEKKADFVEGAVHIPPPPKPTFPYKGIQRLSRPGGYQTCNMFYERKSFLELGGFDKNFPYYLEDTDLAWTFLDNKKKVAFSENAVVSHPVPDPVPKKMLDSAWRMEKLPYLFKKHPEIFKSSNMRALPRPYLLLLCFDFSILAFLFINPPVSLFFSLGRVFLTLAILLRMLRGCHFSFSEFSQMLFYLFVCPIISLYALIKGNITQGVWIFLR